jgi:hypothetical protein
MNEYGQANIVENGLKNEIEGLKDQIYEKQLELENTALY